jgi:hypothetical protein
VFSKKVWRGEGNKGFSFAEQDEMEAPDRKELLTGSCLFALSPIGRLRGRFAARTETGIQVDSRKMLEKTLLRWTNYFC